MRASIVTLIGVFLAGVIALGSGAQTQPLSPQPLGERVIAIIGGDFGSRSDAVAAAESLPFGDVQGFSVARSDGFADEPPGRWLLVSAFRTVRGAAEFEELLRVLRIEVLRRALTTYTGSDAIGLGQEPHPNGEGPLVGPLPSDHPERLR